jgi:hypothetical protein
VRGWIEHRLGDNEASLATFDKLLKAGPENRCLQILAQLGVAAAQSSGTDTVAAKRATESVRQAMHEYREWINERRNGEPYDWQEWLLCELLARELD